jgi:hypothetical protein
VPGRRRGAGSDEEGHTVPDRSTVIKGSVTTKGPHVTKDPAVAKGLFVGLFVGFSMTKGAA